MASDVREEYKSRKKKLEERPKASETQRTQAQDERGIQVQEKKERERDLRPLRLKRTQAQDEQKRR